jgi:hypothetical protein
VVLGIGINVEQVAFPAELAEPRACRCACSPDAGTTRSACGIAAGALDAGYRGVPPEAARPPRGRGGAGA